MNPQEVKSANGARATFYLVVTVCCCVLFSLLSGSGQEQTITIALSTLIAFGAGYLTRDTE